MDRIIETDDGFDIVVNSTRHGTWRSKAEARAALEVEQRRAARQAQVDKLCRTEAEVDRIAEEGGAKGVPNLPCVMLDLTTLQAVWTDLESRADFLAHMVAHPSMSPKQSYALQFTERTLRAVIGQLKGRP